MLKGVKKNIITYELLGMDTRNGIEEYKTNMATLYDLYQYIKFKRENEKITLPNGITCEIYELIDYITLSFTIILYQLRQKKIILQDMHSKNIFIHWLNKNSYMGDQYIGDTEKIIYKIKSVSYQIKTFGFIIKLGDIGASIFKPNDNITIIGLGNDLKNNYDMLKIFENSRYTMSRFLLWNFSYYLPYSIYKNTIVYKILTDYPYNQISDNDMDNIELFDKMLTPLDVINKFNKYKISNNGNKNNKKCLIINI